MTEVPTILKNAAMFAGLDRKKFDDSKCPTNMDKVCVLPFFGDLRSCCVLSMLLLKRYREESKGSKYFVLCSWPGMQGLFPFVDEYWSPQVQINSSLETGICGFDNLSNAYSTCFRKLTRYFDEVIDPSEINRFYNNGITQEFFDRFQKIKVFKPAVSSSMLIGVNFSQEMSKREGFKVFVDPVTTVRRWKDGKIDSIRVAPAFWNQLLNVIIEGGYIPVVQKSKHSYDVSKDFLSKCIYLNEPDTDSTLAAMRACDCVLDVFSGLSRLAIIARCPFLVVDERSRYSACKEYEIDDLCAEGIARQYIFSFSAIIGSGEPLLWKHNIFDVLLARLSKLADNSAAARPPTSEIDDLVSYSKVRRSNVKRFGVRYIKIPRI